MRRERVKTRRGEGGRMRGDGEGKREGGKEGRTEDGEGAEGIGEKVEDKALLCGEERRES